MLCYLRAHESQASPQALLIVHRQESYFPVFLHAYTGVAGLHFTVAGSVP